MKHLLYFFILFCGLQLVHAGDGIAFTSTTFDHVVTKAKTQGKLVFLDFTASWCMPCKQMDKETFSNKMVGDLVNKHFISFKVDNDYFWGMDIAEKYNVNALPTLLVVDADGNEVKRITGFQSAEKLLSELKPLL
ncbi:MAG: thioredoxin fold domain-containing protein [Chitinophagales bacterium]